MTIRNYRPSDATDLATIFYNAVRRIGGRHYNRNQVDAWAPMVGDPSGWNSRASDGRLTLVAVDKDDRPVAYGDLETNGHIDHLYSSPEVEGTGVASAIYDHLERHARERGQSRLYVEASECALALFEHKGFRRLGRNEFSLRGVMIHNYAMEKNL